MRKQQVVAWLPALLWMAIIFAMSSRNGIPHAPEISPELLAATGHLLVYGVLAVLLYRPLQQRLNSWQVAAGIAWLVATLYGVSDEFHQSFVAGRYATIEDVIFDAVGAAAGIFLYRLIRHWSANRQAVA